MLFVATLLTPQISMFERNMERLSFNVRNHDYRSSRDEDSCNNYSSTVHFQDQNIADTL